MRNEHLVYYSIGLQILIFHNSWIANPAEQGLGIRIHAGAPELPVEQVMSMFLNGTIVYGNPSCHHHCEGHLH